MYAIVEAGGHQWKVVSGTQLEINRVSTDVGATHTLEHVLLTHDGQQLQVGRPYLQDAKVICEVLAHRLGPKALSYHFRRRENWRKTVGHRQPLTRLVVKDIVFNGNTVVAEPAKAAPAKTESKPRATKVAAVKPSTVVKKRPSLKPGGRKSAT